MEEGVRCAGATPDGKMCNYTLALRNGGFVPEIKLNNVDISRTVPRSQQKHLEGVRGTSVCTCVFLLCTKDRKEPRHKQPR
jgi:hypothetical protein